MLRLQGESLWRRVAETGMFVAGRDVLVVGSGSGESLCRWAAEYGVDCTGAEPDARLVQAADQRAREERIEERVRFQVARPEDLPFRDGSFDVVIGGVILGDLPEPAPAVAELVRVARPGGDVALLQWVWARRVSAARQTVLRRFLEVPRLAAEAWQSLLVASGVGDVSIGPVWEVDAPVSDTGLRERIGAVRRDGAIRSLRGLAQTVRSERRARLLLGRGSLLGVTLIKGTKWPS